MTIATRPTFLRQLRRALVHAALGWVAVDDASRKETVILVDTIAGILLSVVVAGAVGALIPYAPYVLFSDHLAQSVATLFAYQCLTGPTCDYWTLMGGFALGVYLTVVIPVIALLGVFRHMSWLDAEQAVEAEAPDEDDDTDPDEDDFHLPAPPPVNGRARLVR